MSMKDFDKFAKHIGIKFNNISLLRLAFTHRSFVNENKLFKEHNERLEFLGDAVLELVVTEYLFKRFKDKPEGELTAIRAALVNTQSISNAAEKLGMNDYLLLSKGEAGDTGRARRYILANAFEALVGAVYLDRGYSMAKKFISEHLFGNVNKIVENKLWQDPKSKLQELAQERIGVTPSYKEISATGPDHDKVFTVCVMFDEAEIAQGKGKSKREAQQNAAKRALTIKGWDNL